VTGPYIMRRAITVVFTLLVRESGRHLQLVPLVVNDSDSISSIALSNKFPQTLPPPIPPPLSLCVYLDPR
jgi:hypothetical protein